MEGSPPPPSCLPLPGAATAAAATTTTTPGVVVPEAGGFRFHWVVADDTGDTSDTSDTRDLFIAPTAPIFTRRIRRIYMAQHKPLDTGADGGRPLPALQWPLISHHDPASGIS